MNWYTNVTAKSMVSLFNTLDDISDSEESDENYAEKADLRVRAWLEGSSAELDKAPADLRPWGQTDHVERRARRSEPYYSSTFLHPRLDQEQPAKEKIIVKDPYSASRLEEKLAKLEKEDRGFSITDSEADDEFRGAEAIDFGPSVSAETQFMANAASPVSTMPLVNAVRLEVSIERTDTTVSLEQLIFYGTTVNDLRQSVLDRARLLPEDQADSLLAQVSVALKQIESQLDNES